MTDDVTRQAAAALIGDVADELTSEQPAPEAAETTTSEAPEPSTWQADTSGLDFLEDEDDEPEPPTIVEEPEEEEPEWDEDPAAAKLRKDLAKANKQLAWERDQRVTQSRKQWKAEAERRFPLADVDSITKDSRRATLKAAAEQQAKMEKKLGPTLREIDELRAKVLDEARQQGRQEAAEAWGKPAFGAPAATEVQAVEDAERFKPSAHKSLLALTTAKLKAGILEI